MALPILNVHNAPGEGDLVRFFHRAQLHWMAHLAEPNEQEWGTAFASKELGRVHDANQVMSALVPQEWTSERVVEEAKRVFDEAGTTCFKWTMNPSVSPAQTEPLVELLAANGFQRMTSDIFYLRRMPLGPIKERRDLKLIPARASFRHARQLAEEFARETEPQLADAWMAHLDDPHWDAVLALKDSQAIGEAGVLAVGEIGLVESVYVAGGHRRQGIGLTLMSRALEICARSLFKHVFLNVNCDNEAAQMLYRRLGFEKLGEYVSYARP